MKTKRTFLRGSVSRIAAASAISLFTLLGTLAHAASDRANPPSQNYPSMPSIAPTGVAPAQTVQSAPVPAAAPKAAAPAPAPAVSAAPSSKFTSNLYTVEKTLLSSTQVGGAYQYRLRVTALENVTNVTATEHLPAGLALVGTEPQAKVNGQNLNWSWPSLNKGDVKDLLVTVRPETEGNFVTTSTVCVDPVVVLPFFAGSPRLEITKTAVATAELGDVVPFRIAVRNAGTAVARNVVITDTLPDGITSDSNLKPVIGDLQPGEVREITVVGNIKKGGSLTNIASAVHDGGQPVQAQAVLNVVESKLGLSKTGTTRSYIFKHAAYQIVVSNPGNTTLTNVVVTDELPSGTEVVSSEPAVTPSRGRLTWTLPDLAPGQSRTFNVVLTASKPGDTTNSVSATANSPTGKSLAAKADALTEWEGAPGVMTEITDNKDPVRVGESTIYTIVVSNQGSFKPVNGQFKVTLSKQLRPVSTSGDAQGTIEGQVVTFPDVLLDPRGTTKLRIEAQGVQPGSGRARLEFMSSFLDEPVIKDESTFVY
ncbi:DUF11 domain-containing protein [Geminisphaera colitermitum]|uniref:DUF11 domain-containing protein n=1 Tax=Geminisphaera colitermitum TaxID=1148786 RepID=UPI0001964DC0|nr:DUF11 domain-containing protein [Geminisphaera colitermitum]